jgi:S1-C subfamily serine protease
VNILDGLLILGALIFAISGYRQGFLVGVLSFAGFLGGATIGMIFAPDIVADWQSGFLQALGAVAIVLVCAAVGQAVLGLLGGQLRSTLTWQPARFVDATVGAALSVTALLLFSWFLASALRDAPLPSVAREIRESTVLGAVDQAVPDPARTLFSSFRVMLNENGLPRVFSGLSAEPIRPVEPPTGAAATPEVQEVADSVVKVEGRARSCSRSVEGSGFVFAPERVMTNAHVVAGVREPTVQIGGQGRAYDARIVVYDPRRDLAVLAVPGLDAEPIDFTPGAEAGQEAVVAGFPGGGPYQLDPARIREEIDARGHDIYGGEQVTRQVYSLYGTVMPGNSGGPLLAPDGTVYGVIFAKSIDHPDTGYALTVEEVAPVAEAGIGADDSVSSGDCTAE